MSAAVSSNNEQFDYAGIFVSTLCGIHCLITPLAILYFPALGSQLESAWVHTLLIVLVGIAFHQSIYKHYRLHGSKLTLGLGSMGVFILLISYLVEVTGHQSHGDHEAHSDEGYMIVVTVLGAALLVLSHSLNIWNCRCVRAKGSCAVRVQSEN